MKKKTYAVGIDPDAIRKLKSQITADMQSLVSSFLTRTENAVKNAAQRAQDTFGPAVSVTYEFHRNRLSARGAILASGSPVCFLEFGAGNATDEQHPFADKVSIAVFPGSWSVSDNSTTHEYAETGKWHFGGREYTEIQPRRGMYEAYKAIENYVDELKRTGL